MQASEWPGGLGSGSGWDPGSDSLWVSLGGWTLTHRDLGDCRRGEAVPGCTPEPRTQGRLRTVDNRHPCHARLRARLSRPAHGAAAPTAGTSDGTGSIQPAVGRTAQLPCAHSTHLLPREVFPMCKQWDKGRGPCPSSLCLSAQGCTYPGFKSQDGGVMANNNHFLVFNF